MGGSATTVSGKTAARHIGAPLAGPTVLWRYMDFGKFVAMLVKGALYFPRSDLLLDVFEGSASQRKTELMADFERRFPDSVFCVEQRLFSQVANWNRFWTYISCWHANQVESVGMWDRYTKSPEAVAIKTTVDRLTGVLDETCSIGAVCYIDYMTQQIEGDRDNLLFRFLHKRTSFREEQEVRVILCDNPLIKAKPNAWCPVDFEAKGPDGILKDVDLRGLVEGIVIAPNSPAYIEDATRRLLERYGYTDLAIERSSLEAQPKY